MSYHVPVRRFIRPDQPQPVYPRVVDAVVAKWAGVWSEMKNASILPHTGRVPISMFANDWQPEFDWPYGIVQTTVKTWASVWVAQRNTCKLPELKTATPPLALLKADWDPPFTWTNPVTDAIVARWVSIWTSELGSGRLPSNFNALPDTGTFLGWIFANLSPSLSVAQTLPALIQAYSSYRSADRSLTPTDTKPLDGWSTRIVDAVVAQWTPIRVQQAGAFSSNASPSLNRQHESPIEFGWNNKVVDSIVSQWIAAIESEPSFRSPDRNRAPIETSPQPASLEKVVESILATWTSVWVQQSTTFRSDPVGTLNGRHELPIEFGWVDKTVDAVVSRWTPVWVQQAATEIPLRSSTPPDTNTLLAWLFVNLPPSVTVAQMLPAFVQAFTSYRSADRALAPWESAPSGAWVERVAEAILAQWASVWRQQASVSERTRSVSLPIDTNTLVSWLFVNLPPALSVAQIVPALLQFFTSYRSLDRTLTPTETAPVPGWVERVVEGILAKWTPIWEQQATTFRSDAPAPIDPRRESPIEFGWNNRVVDSVLSKWMPAITSELSYRSPDTSPLELRTQKWHGDPAGWLNPVTDAAVAVLASIWVSLNPPYQPPLRAPLRLTTMEWAPQFGWDARVVDAGVAQFMPAVTSMPNFRSVARPSLSVYTPDLMAVQPAWEHRIVENIVSLWVPAWMSEMASGLRTRDGIILNPIRVWNPNDDQWIFAVGAKLFPAHMGITTQTYARVLRSQGYTGSVRSQSFTTHTRAQGYGGSVRTQTFVKVQRTFTFEG